MGVSRNPPRATPDAGCTRSSSSKALELLDLVGLRPDVGPYIPARSGPPCPAVKPAAASTPMEVRLAYARVSPRTQEIQSQVDALEASGVHRLFHERIRPACASGP